jgi:hypothetical protein
VCSVLASASAGTVAAQLRGAADRLERVWQPLVAWVGAGAGDPLDELHGQGWRLGSVDEHGEKVYTPPARYSVWL